MRTFALLLLLAIGCYGPQAAAGAPAPPVTATTRAAGGLRPPVNASSGESANNATSVGGGVHYYFLLDRSGSMGHLASDVVGGINSYVAEQQASVAEGQRVLFTLVQFDSINDHEVTVAAKPMEDVRPLTEHDYSPRGGTPLYDAIGRLVEKASAAQLADGEGDRVVFVIFTDGEENQSRTFDQEGVAELIRGKEKLGWSFVFLGANIDAFEAGSSIGISRKNTQNFVADDQGLGQAFESLSKASRSYNRQAYAAAAEMSAQEAGAANKLGVPLEADLHFFDGFDGAQRDYEARSSTPGAGGPGGPGGPGVHGGL